MNNREIIEWLNSHESDEWRKKTFKTRIYTMLTIKDDEVYTKLVAILWHG